MVAASLFLSLTVVVLLACANPMHNKLVVHERRESIPEGFIRNSAAPEDEILNLRMALVSNNIPGLETALFDVSTPSSDHYGQHLSKEEV